MHDCGSRRCTETRRHRNERLDTHTVGEVMFGNNYQTMLKFLFYSGLGEPPPPVCAEKMPAIRFSRRGEDTVFENVGPSNIAWCTHLSWRESDS